MSGAIKVHVLEYGASRNLMMRYLCRQTGKHAVRSTATRNNREATKISAKWEAELREGR